MLFVSTAEKHAETSSRGYLEVVTPDKVTQLSRNKLIVTKLSGNMSWKDPEIAQDCVCVAVSGKQNRGIGTYSHLTTGVDSYEYVEQLSRFFGDVRPPVVLVGGDESEPKSVEFLSQLTTHLVDAGFQIVGGVTGGKNLKRQSTIYPDYVSIMSRNPKYIEENKRIPF